MWEKNIDLFKPSYVWPNPAFHFRLYYESDKCRIFIIENIAHNWNWLKDFSSRFRDNDFFIVSLGWYFDEYLVSECNFIFKILNLKRDRFYFMYNDYSDKQLFEYYEFNGKIINQNCFLDENLFMIKQREKIYDALYIARRATFKRHYLAGTVDNLALIAGSNHGIGEVEIPAYKYLNDVPLSPEQVIEKIAEAKVGIILSEYEGACYSSSEYLLCGIPVVSTESKGGRSIWYNSYNSIICDANQEAISSAVTKLGAENKDPQRIRDMHIHLSRHFRGEFIELIQEILSMSGDSTDSAAWFKAKFVHKLLTSETPKFNEIFPA